MLTEEKVDHLIKILESLAIRPQMYVRLVNPFTIESYLDGFWIALSTATESCRGQYHRDRIAIERGWKVPTATGLFPQICDKMESETDAIKELIAIEVEVLTRLKEQQ